MVNPWLALSQSPTGPLRPEGESLLASGLFALEFRLPLREPTVLLDHRQGDATGFSVLYDPGSGVALMTRQQGRILRLDLPGPLPKVSGTAQLTFRFDHGKPGGPWTLRLRIDGVSAALTATGTGAPGFDLNAFDRLCAQADGAVWHESVLWFGLSNGADLPARRPWIGPQSAIQTRKGAVPAGQLRAGDQVSVLDRGWQPVVSVSRIEVPSRGSYAPVLLRKPWFGRTGDILVSADQQVCLGGVSVEYLFGQDEVLVRAADLVGGTSALLENRRAATTGVILELDRSGLVLVDGVGLRLDGAGDTGHRILKGQEAQTLLAQYDPGGLRLRL